MPPVLPNAPAHGGVLIAVVDSGLFAAHPHLAGARIEPGFGVSPGTGAASDEPGATADVQGHGTAVAAALVRSLPGARLMPVRVLDASLRCPSPDLAVALVEATRRGARVLNLSLGSESPEGAAVLDAAVRGVRDLGAVVVAAAAPLPRAGWPADLPGVISVRWDADCPEETWYTLDERVGTAGGGGVRLPRFAACGLPRAAEGRDPTGNFAGSSFACVRVAAEVARRLGGRPDLPFDRLVEDLRRASAGPLPAGHRLR